jgi:glycosyltransferase involved in cell wall biosynthesis
MRFAYVFKRFPVFAQTFVVREVEGVFRQGRQPLIYSIQKPEDAARQNGFREMEEKVRTLPSKAHLVSEILSYGLTGQINLRKCVNLSWLGKSGRSRREALWLGPELKRHGVSQIHTHFTGDAARTAWWVSREFGIPYSITAHANDFLCKNNQSPTLQELVQGARTVIAVSDYSKVLLGKNFPGANIKRVYNGICLHEFEPSPKISTPRILSVGRLVEKKGFPFLLEACRLLAEKGIDFRCDIVGDGPLKQDLHALVSEFSLSGKVFLHGALPQSTILSMLQLATVFALACVEERSGGMDILPTVITEAMTAGLPVVSTRLAGIPEMVVDTETGFLCEPKDIHGFADSLARVLCDPAQASELGFAGRRRAEAIFDERITIPQLLEILEAN